MKCGGVNMREIKFRLILNGRIVGYEKWYCGSKDLSGLRNAAPNWLYSKDGEYWNPKPIFHEKKDQFTGLKDKNGVEIYEGDMVKYQMVVGFEAEESVEDDSIDGGFCEAVVKFDNGQFTPRDTGEYPEDGYYGWRNFRFEVIDNIHDTPPVKERSNE